MAKKEVKKDEEAKIEKPEKVKKEKTENAKKTEKVETKTVKAVEEKQEKNIITEQENPDKDSQDNTTETSEKVLKHHKPQKPHIKHRGKKYKEVAKLIDKNITYLPEEAIDLSLKTSTTKFDSSVEVHIKLGIKPEQTEQNIRTVADLPEGTGKAVKIAAILGSDKEKEAKDAGADIVGGDDLISKIEKGFLDFDIVIATPDQMSKIGKLGKTLGTKGLMPNPKTETVTDNPGRVISKIKKGRVELKNDSFGIIHASFGKTSFGAEKLANNLKALLEILLKAKLQQAKGQFIKTVNISTTMGPSLKVDINKLNDFIHPVKPKE